MTRNESLVAVLGSAIVLWLSLWYISNMLFLQNAITLNAAPGDVGTLAVPVYQTLELLFGRYYLDIFVVTSTIVFLVGSLQAIFTLGENISFLLKGGLSLTVLQFFISGLEVIMMVKKQWSIPTDMAGNMLNLVGQIWLYPIEWFGVSMSLAALALTAVVAVCILSLLVFNYDLYGHRMEPYVSRLAVAAKKKVQLPVWKTGNKILELTSCEQAKRSIENTTQKVTGIKEKKPLSIEEKVEFSKVPVLTTKLTSPAVTRLPSSPVSEKPVPGKINHTLKPSLDTKLAASDSIEDKIKDCLFTLGLGFSELKKHDGVFTTRFSMKPTTAIIGQQDLWRKAEPDIARLMGVAQKDVTFHVKHSDYVYLVNKPASARRTVLFSDLLKKSGQLKERGIEVPLLLGVGIDGQRLISCALKTQDLLIVGRKGSGKSSLLHSILIYQMLWSLKQQQVKVRYYISDINGATAIKYRPLLGGFIQAMATSHVETLKLLEKLSAELRERVLLLQKYNCQHIATLNKKLLKEGHTTLPSIFLVLEEVSTLFTDKATKERLGSLVASIITVGRKYGIFIYSVGTFATKGMFGVAGNNAGKALIEESSKLSFFLASAKDAYTFGGAGFPAHKLIETGDALLKDVSGEVLRLHTPVFSRTHADNDKYIDKYIDYIKQKC